MDESAWIRQAKAGSRSAFAELFRTYQVKAFRTAYLITRDRHLAEDMTRPSLLEPGPLAARNRHLRLYQRRPAAKAGPSQAASCTSSGWSGLASSSGRLCLSMIR